MNLLQLRAGMRHFLAVGETDPAFPPAKLDFFINAWLDSLYADFPSDVLVRSQTLAVDPGQDRQYSFALQSPIITDFKTALEVRAENDSGVQLREKGLSELASFPYPGFAITGADDVAVLTTNVSVKASIGMFLRMAFWPAALVGDDDVPTSVPSRFHHIIPLGAAEAAFASGDEATFPRSYAEQLYDGRAQLLFHLIRRSPDATTTRYTETRHR